MIEQLIDIYHREHWHETRMSDEETRYYYETMLKRGQILTYVENGEILGVCEYAKLNLAQLGYVMISDTINPDIHDDNGMVIYITSLYVKPECRGIGMVSYFKSELEKLHPAVNYFTGETQGKNRKVWHIYKRSGVR